MKRKDLGENTADEQNCLGCKHWQLTDRILIQLSDLIFLLKVGETNKA